MRISDWSSDVCSSDLAHEEKIPFEPEVLHHDENLLVVDKPHFLATMPRGRWVRETDRKSVVSGKSVSVRVDLGGRRIITTKTNPHPTPPHPTPPPYPPPPPPNTTPPPPHPTPT